ncbi:MAG: TIGR02449 family protein [Gammaproteobacteria bacterium]
MDELTQFELQVESVLQSWQHLQKENQRLRQKLAHLAREHSILMEKYKAATTKIKRIIGQLRTEIA